MSRSFQFCYPHYKRVQNKTNSDHGVFLKYVLGIINNIIIILSSIPFLVMSSSKSARNPIFEFFSNKKPKFDLSQNIGLFLQFC